MTRGWLVGVGLCALMLALLIPATPVAAQEASAVEITKEIDGDYGQFPFYLPPAVYAQEYGGQVDKLIHVLHIFSAIVLVAWSGFMGYCLIRYRQRPGHKASYQAGWKYGHIYFVIAFAVFELILDTGLASSVLAGAKDGLPAKADNPQRVRVVAEQFSWNFHYRGSDGVFGKAAPEYVNLATNALGRDPNDPNGADDLVSGELHVVRGRPVVAELSSKDVIHSFSIPVLRVKQDVIPGMRIPVWFEAGKSGNYEIACAQLCGNNHYSMKALLTIHETQAEFDAWFKRAYEAANEEFDEDELD